MVQEVHTLDFHRGNQALRNFRLSFSIRSLRRETMLSRSISRSNLLVYPAPIFLSIEAHISLTVFFSLPILPSRMTLLSLRSLLRIRPMVPATPHKRRRAGLAPRTAALLLISLSTSASLHCKLNWKVYTRDPGLLGRHASTHVNLYARYVGVGARRADVRVV